MFLLILPSPCQADDIYIMVQCVSVCYVFAYFAFPLPSWWYIYYGAVCICLSVTHLPSHLSLLSPLSEREQRFILLLITHSAYHDDYDSQDYKDRLISANIYFSEPSWGPCLPSLPSTASALSPSSERERHFIIRLIKTITLLRMIKMMMIDWEVPIYIASGSSWAPKARSEA